MLFSSTTTTSAFTSARISRALSFSTTIVFPLAGFPHSTIRHGAGRTADAVVLVAMEPPRAASLSSSTTLNAISRETQLCDDRVDVLKSKSFVRIRDAHTQRHATRGVACTDAGVRCFLDEKNTQTVGGVIARLLKLRPSRTSSRKKWCAHERSTFVVHPVRVRRRSISPRVVFNNPNVAVELPRLSAVLNNTYNDARHVRVTESEFDPSRG
jgi:hypothetical protein